MNQKSNKSDHSLPLLDLRTRNEWRAWLEKHHESEKEIWLVFHKTHTGVQCIPYNDSVEEALCFGWVDSLIRRLDEDRYARKFTPRRPGSKWSSVNVKRYETVKAKGLLMPAGLSRPPTQNIQNAPRPSIDKLPGYLEQALRADPRVWEAFQKLAPSHKRRYIGWIDSAKKQETRERRLAEAVEMLSKGERLGMK